MNGFSVLLGPFSDLYAYFVSAQRNAPAKIGENVLLKLRRTMERASTNGRMHPRSAPNWKASTPTEIRDSLAWTTPDAWRQLERAPDALTVIQFWTVLEAWINLEIAQNHDNTSTSELMN